MSKYSFWASGLALTCAAPMVMAFNFDVAGINGAFDSTLAAGAGFRTESRSCDLVTQGPNGPQGHAVPRACADPAVGMGDQGNLNYAKGEPFTTYVKGVHELLLRLPADYTFMARGSWKRDFAATKTTGTLSEDSVGNPWVGSDGLTSGARDDLKFDTRLLDLWLSKSFYVGDSRVRARLGNQVINWGESLFAGGGINETNGYDVMALSTPGTLLKEALLPAPIFSLAAGIGHSVNVEAYYQFAWEKTELAPIGSYWSTTNALGEGMEKYGYGEKDARDSGQWGLSVTWRPDNTDLSLGFYALRYHDKLPSLFLDQTTFAPTWMYPEDRMLYGLSANLPVGDWAVGTELSYRPKDAVALNPLLGCTGGNGKCWKDEKKFQWHLTGFYSLLPSNAGTLLDITGATAGTFLAELVMVHYPDLKDSYNGDPVSAGLNNWISDWSELANLPSKGDKTSGGLSMDFSLTYDGNVIPGWQVTPGIYYSHALTGRTPTLGAPYMKGADSMNIYVSLLRNPGTWQLTMNYAKFMEGDTPWDNQLEDRDYVGIVLSRTL